MPRADQPPNTQPRQPKPLPETRTQMRPITNAPDHAARVSQSPEAGYRSARFETSTKMSLKIKFPRSLRLYR